MDSAVAAYLTLQEGYTCVGATMQLHEDFTGAADAKQVADRLGINLNILDFHVEFRTLVMDDFARCYELGFTPNPCVVCNRKIKFGMLLEAAQALDCSHLVTGHYARITQKSGRYLLYKAVDAAKDQSYFLYALTQKQLSQIRFPLGELTKEQARQIALEQGFVNAKKRDSQDICFIPDGDYFNFLQRHTGKSYPAGNFLDRSGNVIGRHSGAVAYTLGQRKGLGLATGSPVYVCSKDMAANTVTVGPNEVLFHKALRATDWFFQPFDTLTQSMRVMAKTRSRMREAPATVYPEENGFARVEFDAPQRAITPGQAVVLYDGDIVVGGGTITEVL